MYTVPERRRAQDESDVVTADADLAALWDIFDAASQECADILEVFNDSLAEIRAAHPPQMDTLIDPLARRTMDALHALDMAEIFRRRAAYDILSAAAGPRVVDRRKRA